jgi:hypothetical protein
MTIFHLHQSMEATITMGLEVLGDEQALAIDK